MSSQYGREGGGGGGHLADARERVKRATEAVSGAWGVGRGAWGVGRGAWVRSATFASGRSAPVERRCVCVLR